MTVIAIASGIENLTGNSGKNQNEATAAKIELKTSPPIAPSQVLLG